MDPTCGTRFGGTDDGGVGNDDPLLFFDHVASQISPVVPFFVSIDKGVY
jgi:hypothetical protein